MLGRFIEGGLARAQAAGEALCVDFRAALMDMAGQMLQRRRVELSWSDFASWSLAPETLRLIRRLTRHEDLLQVRGSSTDLRLAFRHDPMRDWLFVEVASSMDTADTLPDEILHEPFFAEVLGAVVVRRSVPARLLDRVRRLNPLALFQALRVCPQGSGTSVLASCSRSRIGWQSRRTWVQHIAIFASRPWQLCYRPTGQRSQAWWGDSRTAPRLDSSRDCATGTPAVA